MKLRFLSLFYFFGYLNVSWSFILFCMYKGILVLLFDIGIILLVFDVVLFEFIKII